MTIRTIDMTDHEYELYRQFIREHDQKNSPRQQMPMDLKCPNCGNNEFAHVEDISCARDVEGIEDGVITINGLYTTDGYDVDGINPRVVCLQCGVEYDIPDDVELDFV